MGSRCLVDGVAHTRSGRCCSDRIRSDCPALLDCVTARPMTSQKVFFDRALIMSIILAGLIVALAISGDTTRETLQWTRSGVKHGEWWRLITAHVVHLNPFHAMLNAVVLILLAALFGRIFTLARHGVHAIIGILFIDAGLIWLGNLE
ncbi:MAG: rhomboid family intramembrane serine protease [Gammaproteobacteria bacterium]|nr:rhomboid family intramembrane serine protease [Gammaproteobacteria bacterium]